MSSQHRAVSLFSGLSDWIARLHQQSQQCQSTEFKQWCFSHLNQILPFDSGLWWTRSDLIDKEHAHWAEDTCVFNQPREFMQNYSRVASRPNNPDPLNLHLSSHVGEFFSIWDVCDREVWYQKDYYLEHCKQYGIEQAISALTLPSKYSPVTHIFSFYRADRALPFSDNEKHTLKSLLPHLLEAFSANLLSSFDTKNKAAVRGVIDRYGKIVMAEEAFRGYMTEKGLLSDDLVVIPDLKSIIEPVTVELAGIQLDLSFHEGLVYVEVFDLMLTERLSHRQKEVCQLITKGCSNKEIANLLGVEVHTVNSHVQKALRVLKVNSREAATSYLVRQALQS